MTAKKNLLSIILHFLFHKESIFSLAYLIGKEQWEGGEMTEIIKVCNNNEQTHPFNK